MPKLLDLSFQNGTIQFRDEVKAKPATTERDGNVTINHAAQLGVPAYYVVSFSIRADFEHEGVQTQGYLNIELPILSGDENTPYRLVEAQGARELAPALRSVADRIEQAVADFDRQTNAPAD